MTVSFIIRLVPLFAVSSNLWEELSDAAGLVIALLFILAGGLIGFVLRWLMGRWQADSIERSARLKAEAAQAEIESLRKEAQIAARAEVVKAREEFEASVAAQRADQAQAEQRLNAREESLEKKSVLLDAREAALREKSDAAEKAAKEARENMAIADARLQKLAKMTHLEARREILKHANAALREDAEKIADAVQDVLEEVPPELFADLCDGGLTLCGGSSRLYGLDRLLGEKLRLPVRIAPDGEHCAAKGAGYALAQMKQMEDHGLQFRVRERGMEDG